MMKDFRRYLLITTAIVLGSTSYAQYNNSGISAGFFDSSENNTINFSNFHLPPLAVLFENAKQNPNILSLEKAQELAKAEVAKQKRHIFSYVHGHASYSYGKTDMWGQGSEAYTTVLKQYQGREQSYWNVGVNLAVPLALKTAGEAAAAYQGAGALNLEDFHQGNMSIEDYAWTKQHEVGSVSSYQSMQTQITTDIITLEILSHTPILTNTTTEITLDSGDKKTEKQIRKENKALDKRIRKVAAAEEKKYAKMEAAEKKAQEKAAKEAAKTEKKNKKK